jgi:hypothetical protein
MILRYPKYLLFVFCLKGFGQSTPKTDRTFYHDKFIHIDSISKSEYDKISPSDNLFDIDTTNTIKARHDSLILPIENGTKVIFTDTIINEGWQMRENKNIGSYKSLPYYIVNITYWEAGEYVLINKKSGKRFSTSPYPLLSPDKKFLIASIILPYIEGTFNDIQLFEINKTELKEKFNIKPEKFQIEQLKWISNDKLAVQIGLVGVRNTYGIITLKK